MSKIKNPLKDRNDFESSFTDSQKEHRALLASMADPMKEHRALLASMADPMKEHRALMASMADRMKEHRALLVSVADPMKEHRALLASMPDPMKEHRALMASMADRMKENRALLASVADPMKEHRALLASMADPLKDFRASIAAIPNSFTEFSASIANSASLKFLKDVATSIGPELSIEADGSFSLSAKRMAFAEVQDLSYQLIQDSSVAPSASLEESINKLVEAIRSQKDPLTQKLLIWFIYPLIIVIIGSFINPVVDYHVKSRLNSDKRSLSKQISSSLRSSDIDKTILKSFRFVSADFLNVRRSASQKSKSIGQLSFGNTVLVLERKKCWTLIEWKDPITEVQITGWVFSRYLSKFK